jgi:hypothetical protein
MRIATTRAGESLDSLAQRVFAFETAPSKAKLRAAATALQEANPLLRKLTEVDPGTPVVVPPLPDAEPSGDTEPLEVAGAAALLGNLRQLLDEAVRSFGEDIAADMEETSSSATLMRSREVKQGAAESDAAEALRTAEAAAKQRTADAKRLQQFHEQVRLSIEDDLRELHSLLGRE